jgi:hypothetical protein
MDSTILAYYRLCACLSDPHPASNKVIEELFGKKDKSAHLYVSDGVVHASFVGGGVAQVASGGPVMVYIA